ncbi:hypothetical protein LCGC14_1397530 [marine sediment metagenome]|uniref:Uncharacterized protein n=1 Tax=marine sediment metagenome TaxID=412755 RepID=A0A0F9MDN9_9ZZZZ
MSMKFNDVARRIELFIEDLQSNDDDIIYAKEVWEKSRSLSQRVKLYSIS